MGFCPFRAFPSTEAVAPFDARNPRDVGYLEERSLSSGEMSASPAGDTGRAHPQHPLFIHAGCPAFRAWHLDEVRCLPIGVSRPVGPMLSWGSASPGFHVDQSCDGCFQPSSSHELQSLGLPALCKQMSGSPRPRLSGVSLGLETDRTALADLPTLVRFSTSSPFSRVRNPRRPWLMISPRVAGHVTAPGEPSSDRLVLLPEPLEK
jgi:hypothetical protein